MAKTDLSINVLNSNICKDLYDLIEYVYHNTTDLSIKYAIENELNDIRNKVAENFISEYEKKLFNK